MARKYYGLGAADVVAQVSGDDGDYEPASRVFDVYTTRTGSTQHTDLLNAAGSAVTAVTAAADGTVRFQGADAYEGSYFLQDQAHPSDPRVGPFIPHDTVDRLVDVEASLAAGGGAYVLPEDGIPASDLDEATQGLIAGAIQGDGTATSLLFADGSELALGDAEQVVRVNAAGTAFETHTPDPPALDDNSDVSATDPVDGAVMRYSEADGEWQAVDASSVFAAVDSNGDLAPASYPPGFIPIWVVNSGDPNPAESAAGDLVLPRTAVVATLGVSSVGTANNGTTPSSSQTVSNTDASFASGDYALVLASVSAEATYPTGFTATGPTNIGAMTAGPATVQGSTVGSLGWLQKATGTVSTSSTFTVTASGGTASRDDWAAMVLKLTGLAASSPIDLSGTGGGSNTTSLSVATSGPTSVPNQIAIAWFGYNPDIGGTFTPTGGWTLVGSVVQSTDTTPRALAVVTKTLTSTGIVTATASLTNPVVYSAGLVTVKAA